MSAEWTPELATGTGIVFPYLAQRPHPPDRDDGAALRVGIRLFGRHAVKDAGRLRSAQTRARVGSPLTKAVAVSRKACEETRKAIADVVPSAVNQIYKLNIEILN